jgi:hypothetical protein
MYDRVRLLKQKFALEQRIRTLSNPSLTEGKDITNLLSKMNAMLENVNQQIAELGLPQDQMTSAMPMDNPVLPQQVPVSEYDSHPDHEVQMAKSDLYRAAHSAAALEKMLGRISEQEGLEGWVQAKITKAADYLESVYHYLDYEMHGEVDEAVAAFGPGQENPNNTPQGYGAPAQQPPGAPPPSPMAKPGQSSPTPPAGGATPGGATPGMVKMSKLDANKKPQGTPIMVKSSDIASKQKMGFAVIGESKEEKKVVHCSQCGKGFSGGGLKPPHHTGFSHCKDHKGMKVIAEDASGGASSAGGMAAGMGNGTGFASGGIGMQKRKKKVTEGGDYSPKARGIADGYYGRPANPHKIVPDEQGKNVRVKLTDPAEVAEYMAGYKDDSFGSKDYGESVAEAGFSSGISTPTMRAKTASKFGHDPDRAAPMYKANKYDPKTGLGGYVAPRGDTTDKSNILLQLKSNLDTATGKPLTFQDGSTLAIKPSIARTALAKIEGMRPVEKHETIKNLMTSKDAFVSFVKGQGESKETGPKFTGYWKAKDKGTPGKKLVGDA